MAIIENDEFSKVSKEKHKNNPESHYSKGNSEPFGV